MRNLGAILENGGRVYALDRSFASHDELDKFVQAADQLAGRQLSAKELRDPFGVHQHAYDRLPPRAKYEDAEFKPTLKGKPAVDANPFRGPQVEAVVSATQRAHGLPIDREKRYEQLAREWDENKSAEAAAQAEAEAATPIIKAAIAAFDRLRFSPTATIEDVRTAFRAVKQASAKGADLTVARQMVKGVITAETARIEAETASIDEQRQRSQARLANRPEVEPDAPQVE